MFETDAVDEDTYTSAINIKYIRMWMKCSLSREKKFLEWLKQFNFGLNLTATKTPQQSENK